MTARNLLKASEAASLRDSDPSLLVDLASVLETMPSVHMARRPDGSYHGRCEGRRGAPACVFTVRALDIDEDSGSAHFDFCGREALGTGSLSGLLTARIEDGKIVLEAEAHCAGFGARADAVEHAAREVLGEIATAVTAAAVPGRERRAWVTLTALLLAAAVGILVKRRLRRRSEPSNIYRR